MIEIESDLGLSATIDIKAVLSGADKETVLPTLDGNLINHEYLNGKIVLIDFWYIQCPPCRRELPALSELSKMYPGKEVIILSIARDPASDIIEYDLDHSDENVHIISGAKPYLANNQMFNFPFKVLLDPEGQMVYSFLGGKKTSTPVKDFVEDMSGKINTLIAATVLP